jgi:hypothetical protein
MARQEESMIGSLVGSLLRAFVVDALEGIQ